MSALEHERCGTFLSLVMIGLLWAGFQLGVSWIFLVSPKCSYIFSLSMPPGFKYDLAQSKITPHFSNIVL